MKTNELQDENKKLVAFIENLISSARNPENRKLNDMANYLDSVIGVAVPLLANSKTYEIVGKENQTLREALVDIEYVTKHEGAYVDPIGHIGNIVHELIK